MQLTEEESEPEIEFDSRMRQVICGGGCENEEDWEINFCSFRKRARKPGRGRLGDDEMPSRCHFQSWLVRTSLIVPLHRCRTLTIVAAAWQGEHVNLGKLTENCCNDDLSLVMYFVDRKTHFAPNHYPQKKFTAMMVVEYMKRSILSLPHFAREQLPPCTK